MDRITWIIIWYVTFELLNSCLFPDFAVFPARLIVVACLVEVV